ncbi:mechanosensitive ion channel family protein, partial [Pseudonocardia sp. KRD-169]|nr:mechanosensitive ion channel family protein [Pseudonocardia abyssalis]
MNDLLPAQPACASEAGTWCARFYQWTNNDFLARSADTIVGTGLKILLILVLAFLARF